MKTEQHGFRCAQPILRWLTMTQQTWARQTWAQRAWAQQAWLLLILVVIDLAVKMVMLHVLPPGQPLHECVACLIVRENATGLGSSAQQLVARAGTQPLIDGAVFGLVLAALLLLLALTSRLTKWSATLSVVVAFGCALGLATLAPSLEDLPVPRVAAALRVAQTLLLLTIWALTTSSLWKAGALLYAAAALGNCLSLFFPPFLIVDYLWSSPLNRLMGMGVFNFADILWLIGSAILMAALVAGIVRRMVLLWAK
jgi:lipoprotein signal peptidase